MAPLWFLLACASKPPPREPASRPEPAAVLSEAEGLLEQARTRAAAEDKRILVHVGSPG